MKVKYELEGMSCGGCVRNVKQSLLQIPDITDADVQLNPQTVVLTMNRSITLDELQAQLEKSGHYTIKETLNN